jgi:glycosyl transferase family 25
VNKVVYINLCDRVDRKEHIEEQLTKYIVNSKIYRFNAIKNEKGAIGCALSHIAVLEMAITENWDSVFIVEDDFMWTEHFTNGYSILEKIIQKDYDVIVLGGSFVKSYKNSFKLISCNCALAYIVNKSYYEKLLKCFKNAVEGLIKTYDQPTYAIDQYWKYLQRRDNWYIIKPNMAMQIPSYSDIENKFEDYSLYFNTNLEYDKESDPERAKQFLNLLENKKPSGYQSIRYYKIDDRFNDNYNTNWSKTINISTIESSFEELSFSSTKQIVNTDINVNKNRNDLIKITKIRNVTF